jgi:hypothetical protein
MRDSCMLSFTKEQVGLAGDYCETCSSPLPSTILDQIQITDRMSNDEVVMAPSPAQCSWLISLARMLRPDRGGCLSLEKYDECGHQLTGNPSSRAGNLHGRQRIGILPGDQNDPSGDHHHRYVRNIPEDRGRCLPPAQGD